MKIENVIFIMGVLRGKHDREDWFIFWYSSREVLMKGEVP